MLTSKHLVKNIKDDYRLICISDIHGHLERFKGLLNKVKYNPLNDYLVILGDFVEKGDQVLETIHYIQKLSKYDKCYVLMGNCEWALWAMLEEVELASQIPMYLKRVSSNGVIRMLYEKNHYRDGHQTMLGIQKEMRHTLHKELQFIKHLPTTLKFNDFLFVHAGVEKGKDYKKCSLSSYLEMQRFMDKGHDLKETVIVGHLPTSNYHPYKIQNDIIYNKEKRIISIDGGVGVKNISQLNALIITNINNNITYSQVKYQDLPTKKVIKDTIIKSESHKISFPYYKIEIIEEGKDFTKCFQEDTNQMIMIKNEFIYKRNNEYYCLDDYTDYFINASTGDTVNVIGIYGNYAYVILNNEVGWILLENLR